MFAKVGVVVNSRVRVKELDMKCVIFSHRLCRQHMSGNVRNVPSLSCAQLRLKSACAFTQSDPNLHWEYFGEPMRHSVFIRSMNPESILYKYKAGRYRPVRVADGPITARYRFIKNASWKDSYHTARMHTLI